MHGLTKIVVYSLIATLAIIASVYLSWWLQSRLMLRAARRRKVRATRRSLWSDPGEVERLDFAAGPGGRDGAPVPPFRFVAEHSTGSSPCLSVVDARGRTWRVKWGDEVKSETFATRLAWAAGYFVERAHYVAAGVIEGEYELTRARECVGDDCAFRDARFELDEAGVRKLFDEHGWAWDDNPFAGTHELAGLKIMLMLTSNWDNKDVRDVARGSNTAVFEYALEGGLVEARYLIIDWGASMGKWGSNLFRSKWDAAGYEAQTPEFVAGVENGLVRWNYIGQRTAEAREQISVEDVRWLCRYVCRITDAQLRDGLRASGATAEEIATFTRAIRARLDTLKRIGE
ncbi:MAG TPA: hypothetical protein VGO96_15810 [Pyrinomonadaceae bacterium]|nr:hypothetical protein [Pyrinomonadaceae bacterium]